MLFSYLRVTIHAQGQAPPTDTQIVTRGKFYTASASDKSVETDQPETLGTSDSLAAAEPRAGVGRKTDGSQKPIHNFQDQSQQLTTVSRNS